jgi:hypothetical protein
MVEGNFSLRVLTMPSAVRRNSPRSPGSSSNSTEKMIHSLVPFENALAVSELAFGVGKLAHLGAIEKTDGGDAFGNRMAVRARVAVDGGAGPAGNAGQRFEATQTALDGEIDQALQLGAGAGRDAVARGAQTSRRGSAGPGRDNRQGRKRSGWCRRRSSSPEFGRPGPRAARRERLPPRQSRRTDRPGRRCRSACGALAGRPSKRLNWESGRDARASPRGSALLRL